MRLSKVLLLVAAFSFVSAMFFGAAEKVIADDNGKTDPKSANKAGTITGRIVLPAEVPDWFRGGKLSFEKAVVLIEGMYKGPRLKRPDNYREMSLEERKAWSAEYRKTEAYQEYQRKMREAYENRPVWKFPVEADGSFKVEGLKLARYNVIPVIPHPAAKGKELAEQSWGSAFRQIVLSEKRKSISVGKMELKLKNVVMPGDVAPSWIAQTYDGEKLKSSDFRGKYYLVDFWATWCIPCIAEIPNLEKIYKEFGGDQFEIIGLSLDEKPEAPNKFLKKRPSAYLQGYLGAWNDSETPRDFGVKTIPSIWLIGPDGRVIARDLGGEKIRDAVRAALRKPAAKK